MEREEIARCCDFFDMRGCKNTCINIKTNNFDQSISQSSEVSVQSRRLAALEQRCVILDYG